MLLRRAARLLAVLGIVAGAGGIGLATPAYACACGGAAWQPGDNGRVADETALVAWDGQHETIDMRLGLQASGQQAALIVPTPAPATVTLGNASTFTELERLSAPKVVTERKWFGNFNLDFFSFGGAAESAAPTGAAEAGAPTVLDRVQLGPMEATTFTGGDLTGIRKWLSDNGYQMRDAVIATLQPYLDGGWSFVAMRLTSTAALNGALDPVRLTFAADHEVYPMRMSSAATAAETVRIYVLGAHEVERNDPDDSSSQMMSQVTNTYFTGHVDPVDADLRQLSANGRNYLTAMTITIRSPEHITSDFSFTPAASDVDYREEQRGVEYVQFLGIPAGFAILLGIVLLGPALGLLTAARRLVRRGRA
ncbi:DUF2330 domain-containing protein [Nocardia sp. NPDC059240]|uniref:DUF2330 domain-containing protein n=1 Tax=Nocardia sp. NPDC059240 TaxID=3346786 RepID=UPI003695B9EA